MSKREKVESPSNTRRRKLSVMGQEGIKRFLIAKRIVEGEEKEEEKRPLKTKHKNKNFGTKSLSSGGLGVWVVLDEQKPPTSTLSGEVGRGDGK